MSDPIPGLSNLESVLRSIPLFANLGPAELEPIIRSARRLAIPQGTQVITEGAVGETLIVILRGEFEVSKLENGRPITLAIRSAGDFLGEMALLEHVPRTASVRALSDGEILEVDATDFQRLLQASPTTSATILRTIAGRLRSTEASLMQREKLASLGTLAAGLAHELNNPAAAIQRSGSQLDEALTRLLQCSVALAEGEHRMPQDFLLGLLPTLTRRATPLPPREAAAVEGALIDRLEQMGINQPWEVGPTLANSGWTLEDLDAAVDELGPTFRNVLLEWLGAGLAARELISELERSSRAISDIVRAVKSYSYMDQAAIQRVDVIGSLEDTLMILKHKLGDEIVVVRNYDDRLPPIEAYGSELNQVWTNLVDNAIDAMDSKGTIELRASLVGDKVEVSIANTGPQIPPEHASRLFDPFFTTKAQGLGTGLGLHVSHNIVVNRHGGEISFSSVPGRTEFIVRLPEAMSHREVEAGSPPSAEHAILNAAEGPETT